MQEGNGETQECCRSDSGERNPEIRWLTTPRQCSLRILNTRLERSRRLPRVVEGLK